MQPDRTSAEGIVCPAARLADAATVAEITRCYQRDGFVILRGYATPAEAEELGRHAQASMQRLAAASARAGEPPSDIRKNLQVDSPWLATQLTSGAHVPLMKKLIGDELEPATAAWFDRPPGAKAGINPHIDVVGGSGSEGATIWIALDAADQGNGCLHYGRGSHRMQHPDGIYLDGFDTEANAVPIEVEPGDAAIHNALTVHWSGANPSERPRRAVSFFYWGAGSRVAFLKEKARKKL